MNRYLLLLAIFLVACGKEDQHLPSDAPPVVAAPPTETPSPPPTETPPQQKLYNGPAEFRSYVVKFLNDGKAQGREMQTTSPMLEIKFGDLSNWGANTIGLCERGIGYRRVTIHTKYWNRVSSTNKELLMHHELGHCVLKRPHRKTKLSNGNPASVMYPIMLSSSVYKGNYNHYQEELYTYGTMLQSVEDEVYVCGDDH